ncbi:hypothetical protein IQ241_10530 [Romeria aff. gracilis LEGE 07310]|uniref:Uncharacterized protein n=1 Tax=Vasconcelosia minhoensis LEGE 07310 TaxID=915328 RepID=A0A8J7AXA7_9CYAN|nr:hypothetical protein [Romeria gracilis]MBE9077727.1 hypothetical protein [Romeria aff. gracilis LEGE 07310]
MNLQEFENQYRESVDEILNKLQSLVMLSTKLEADIVEVGQSVQVLSRNTEVFIEQQRQAGSESE